MEIILLKNVENLGGPGDVVEVADGYARNYLIPQQMAERATPENVTRWKQKKQQRERERQRQLEEARGNARAVDGASLTIPARAGEEGKLFGSVTSRDIVEVLEEETGARIDARDVRLEKPLGELGEFDVGIHFHEDIEAHVTVAVVPEED